MNCEKVIVLPRGRKEPKRSADSIDVQFRGGPKVDLEAKKRDRMAYFSMWSAPLFYSFVVPVDLDDLKKETVERPFGPLISRSDLKELAKHYPKKCLACGYERFHYMEYEDNSVGSEASFTCPYCGKKTDLNWSDNW